MDARRLEEYCTWGERADKFLREGRPSNALEAYNEILRRLQKSKDMDSYLMAKITLGVLRCQVKLGDFKAAYSVWNAPIEDAIFGMGICALENAQTTVRDMIIYDMICAFLHSLGAGEKKETATAITQYMGRVCGQASEDGDRALMSVALSNWKQHMREVFGSAIPFEVAQPLIRFEKAYGETVKVRAIDFPLPTPWEKPKDFVEMSKVLQMTAEVSEHPRSGRSSSSRGHKIS